jgi:hypothetical protein
MTPYDEGNLAILGPNALSGTRSLHHLHPLLKCIGC